MKKIPKIVSALSCLALVVAMFCCMPLSASSYSSRYAVATGATSDIDVLNIVVLIGMIILAIVFYYIPALAAKSKKHENSLAIFLLNTFLGWTFFGWVICLVWAVKKSSKQQVYYGQNTPMNGNQPNMMYENQPNMMNGNRPNMMNGT